MKKQQSEPRFRRSLSSSPVFGSKVTHKAQSERPRRVDVHGVTGSSIAFINAVPDSWPGIYRTHSKTIIRFSWMNEEMVRTFAPHIIRHYTGRKEEMFVRDPRRAMAEEAAAESARSCVRKQLRSSKRSTMPALSSRGANESPEVLPSPRPATADAVVQQQRTSAASIVATSDNQSSSAAEPSTATRQRRKRATAVKSKTVQKIGDSKERLMKVKLKTHGHAVTALNTGSDEDGIRIYWKEPNTSPPADQRKKAHIPIVLRKVGLSTGVNNSDKLVAGKKLRKGLPQSRQKMT